MPATAKVLIRPRLFVIGELNSPILKALSRNCEVLDRAPDLRASTERSDLRPIVAVDASATSAGPLQEQVAIRQALQFRSPIVLENVKDSAAMAAVAGVGVTAELAVFVPGSGNTPGVLTVLGPPATPGTPEPGGAREELKRTPEQEAKMAQFPKGAPTREDQPSAPPVEPASGSSAYYERLAEQARSIVAAPQFLEFEAPGFRLDPVPEGAPHLRTLVNLNPCSYHPQVHDWHHSKGTPITLHDVTATMGLGLYVELYASSNPSNKFLRITPLGAGFNVSKLHWDKPLERGCFQDLMSLAIGPSSPPSGFVLIDAQPKTVNNEASYTASTELTFGVKNKEASATARIASSISSKMSAFNALDQSAGSHARWEFQMSMCGNPPSGVYNVADPLDIVDFWGTVWDVVPLSKSTLFPACQACWTVPLSCSDRIPMALATTQRLAYAASDRITKMASSMRYPASWGFTVNFGAVRL